MPGKRDGNVDIRLSMAECDVRAVAAELYSREESPTESNPHPNRDLHDKCLRALRHLGSTLHERDVERIRRDRRDGTAGRK